MSTEIVKLNPAEYGLQEAQALTIEQAFMPKIAEREGMRKVYEGIICQEITPELCSVAKEARLKLVKVRTGIAEIHKMQKAFYLAAGRYVDAWKNKETAPVEQMEEKLKSIEDYYENIEKERKTRVREERTAELLKYEIDGSLVSTGEMTDDVWNIYISGVKMAYEKKKDDERKAEEERVRQVDLDKKEIARKIETAPYSQFMSGTIDLRSQPDDEYAAMLSSLKQEKQKWEAEQAEIRLQNARLQAERDEAARRVREAEAALAAKQKAEEDAAAAAKREREADEKRIRFEEKKKAAAPDKDKLKALVETIRGIELPDVKTEDAKRVVDGVTQLLDKVCDYINDRTNSL